MTYSPHQLSIFIVLFMFLTFILAVVADHKKDHEEISKILNGKNYFDDLEKLTSDLLFKTQYIVRHCYTIISDDIYQQILTKRVFIEMATTATYITIHVPIFEDTLKPKKQIIDSLTVAKKYGCEIYLIYLANGIQVERLLRFVDEYRLINTKANFIIFYDYRLFVPNLHYLWKRIINVIFIRKYQPPSLTMNEESSGLSAELAQNLINDQNINYGNIFELSGVPFPLAIHEIFVVKHLDFWRLGKFRRDIKFFNDKTLNIKSQLLNVVVLEHMPAVTIQRKINDGVGDDNYYSGLEVQIIKSIAKVMNFTIDLYQSIDSETEKWGIIMENGSSTGIFNEIINGFADIALADIYYIPYNLEKMDLTIPYATECLTFLTPEALTDNSWQTLILPFSSGMWAGVLFFLFFIVFIFYILSQIHLRLRHREALNELTIYNNNHHEQQEFDGEKINENLQKQKYKIVKIKNKPKNTKQPQTVSIRIKVLRRQLQAGTVQMDLFDSFLNCIFLAYSMILIVSLPRLPRSWSIRVLTGWYWIYCILVVVAYRASLTAILANPAPRLTIDTLMQLAQSQISYGAWGDQNKEFFLSSLDETSQIIGQHLEKIQSANEALDRVADGKYAYYENEYFLKDIRSKRDVNIEKESLHIMKECVIHMPISIGLEKNSPLKERIDKFIRYIIEAGLIGKWLRDVEQVYASTSTESEPKEALMELKKLYGAFVALSIGYGISLLVLIGENIYWKFGVMKNPLYDEYALNKLYLKS